MLVLLLIHTYSGHAAAGIGRRPLLIGYCLRLEDRPSRTPPLPLLTSARGGYSVFDTEVQLSCRFQFDGINSMNYALDDSSGGKRK